MMNLGTARRPVSVLILALALAGSAVAQGIAKIDIYTHDEQGRLLGAEGIAEDGLPTRVEFRYDDGTNFTDTPFFYRYHTVKPTSCTDRPATSAMIERYYNTILRRPSDPGGVDYWAGVVTGMCAGGARPEVAFSSIVSTFFHSDEYLSYNRDNAAFVTDLYVALLKRQPESGGLAYWTNQLDTGAQSRDQEMNFILTQSAESIANMNAAFSGQTYDSPWLRFSDLVGQQ